MALSMSSKIILIGFPIVIGLGLIEYAILKRRKMAFSWKEAFASFAVAIGGNSINAFLVAGVGIGVGLNIWLWDHRLFTIPMNTWWSWVALFFGYELFYYWQHRCSHEIRWLWVNHFTHHTMPELNILNCYRLGGATARIVGAFLFYLPLVWIGFDPIAVGIMFALSIEYQSWLHTDIIPKLGWFEKIFNTPSHHRVHHARNVDYLDKNYGGTLIIFDKVFGTFAEERADEPCDYGLVKPINSCNPIKLIFNEWYLMLRDVFTAKTWRARFGYLFCKPGWQPDGQGMTSDDLRRVKQAATGAPALVE